MICSTRSITLVIVAAIYILVTTQVVSAVGPAPTAFNYQGQLKQGGVPVNDTCDFEISLWDGDNDPVPGTQVGSTIPLAAKVVNGLFQVELDFGAEAFNGDTRWLQVDVCCSSPCSPTFVALSPRQPVSATPLSIHTRGIHVDATGNVGIGTKNPAQKLDVRGQLKVQDSIRLDEADDPMIVRQWDPMTSGRHTGFGRWGMFMESEKLFIGMPGTDLVNPSSIRFGGWLLDSTREDWMTIEKNGKIGIGTTTPSAETTLHVRAGGDDFGVLVESLGASGSEIGLHAGPSGYASLVKNAFFAPGWTRFEDTQGAFLQEIDPGGNVRFYEAPPDTEFINWNISLTLSAEGNVGVATSNPDFPFHVKKTHTGDWIAGIHNTGIESLDRGLVVRADGGDPLLVQSASGNLLNIKQNGNIGIGMTQPAAKLEVVHSIRTSRPSAPTQYLEMSSPGFQGQFFTARTGENNKKALFIQNVHDGSGSPAGSSDIVFRTGVETAPTNEIMLLKENGNVGIGTSNPLSALHLGNIGKWSWIVDDGWGDFSLNNGRVGLSFGIATGGGGTGDARIWTKGGIERLIIGNPTVGDILSVHGDGNVGIGTLDPLAKLDVRLGSPPLSTPSDQGVVPTISAHGNAVTDPSKQAVGVYGYTDNTDGIGVMGLATQTGGIAVGSIGNFVAIGTKSFVQPHPVDPSKEIHFVSLEGNESGTYFRGSGKLNQGRTVITVPEDFRYASEAGGLTVQVTALGPNANLWVESKDVNRIVVRGEGDAEFDYFVNGVRRGFAEFKTIRKNRMFVPRTQGKPFLTQLPDAARKIMVENGTLNADFTPNEQTADRLGWKLKNLDTKRIKEEKQGQ